MKKINKAILLAFLIIPGENQMRAAMPPNDNPAKAYRIKNLDNTIETITFYPEIEASITAHQLKNQVRNFIQADQTLIPPTIQLRVFLDEGNSKREILDDEMLDFDRMHPDWPEYIVEFERSGFPVKHFSSPKSKDVKSHS